MLPVGKTLPNQQATDLTLATVGLLNLKGVFFTCFAGLLFCVTVLRLAHFCCCREKVDRCAVNSAFTSGMDSMDFHVWRVLYERIESSTINDFFRFLLRKRLENLFNNPKQQNIVPSENHVKEVRKSNGSSTVLAEMVICSEKQMTDPISLRSNLNLMLRSSAPVVSPCPAGSYSIVTSNFESRNSVKKDQRFLETNPLSIQSYPVISPFPICEAAPIKNWHESARVRNTDQHVDRNVLGRDSRENSGIEILENLSKFCNVESAGAQITTAGVAVEGEIPVAEYTLDSNTQHSLVLGGNGESHHDQEDNESTHYIKLESEWTFDSSSLGCGQAIQTGSHAAVSLVNSTTNDHNNSDEIYAERYLQVHDNGMINWGAA